MAQGAKNEQLHGMSISDTSIRQPVFITMMALVVMVIGLLAYTALPVNLLPDFDFPVVAVSINYSGASPETMALQVTDPIEETLNTIAGVSSISSTSNEGLAQIVVQFDETVNADQAIQEVREKVNAVVPRLPGDVSDPVFQRFDLGALPILQVAIASDGSLTPLELRELIDERFVPALQRVSGVGSVSVSGGEERQINVQLDLARLQAYSLLPAQVSSAIDAANANLGLGNIDSGTQRISLRVPSQIQSIEDIARIPITGTPYRVSDVATVSEGAAEVATYARLEGQDAVALGVVKQTGSNTVTVGEEARIELERLLATYPNLRYTITADQSDEVRASVDSSIEELILAIVAALVVVLFFFRDLRNTLVTMAGLPVIMIGTFAAMWLFGISINVISLLALSLAVGLVIDDAIVVRENIFRYLERGYSPVQAASRATAEVSLSVLAMTLTIIAVFLPVAFTSGVTGFIFKAFGITVASAMAISLVEAFTIAPMLSANLFKGNKHHASHAPSDAAGDMPLEAEEKLGLVGRLYEGLLRWSLRHRFLQVGITLVVLAVSAVVASGLKLSFFPSQEGKNFQIVYTTPPGTNLAETDRLARQAEAILMNDPEIDVVQTEVGGSGGSENGSFTVRLFATEAGDAVRERLRPQLTFLPDMVFGQETVQGDSTASVTSRSVQIQVRADKPLAELAPLAEQLEQVLQQQEGLIDVGSSYTPGRPELRFVVDPARTEELSITSDDIARSVRALIDGDVATTLRESGSDTDVVVRLAPNQRADLNELRGISLPTPGGSVLLSSVADIQLGSSPTSIRRTDQQNEIVLGANVGEGFNQLQVEQQLRPKIEALGLPGDVSVNFGGASEDQAEGFETLFIAMGLSVLFVYVVLASQFGSFLQPLVIMLAMPFSFIGAFVAIRISGLALDIFGLIGLVLLLGLVVKNSILLVDFANRLRAGGMARDEALARAGAIRLRPILMTSTAIVAGAIPVAFGIHFFSSGEGAEFRRPLAVVLIGGMITSTLLTLLVVPTAYSLLDSLTSGVSRLFRRRERTPQVTLVPAVGVPGGLVVASESANGNSTNGAHHGTNGAQNGANGAQETSATANPTAEEAIIRQQG